MRANRRSFLDLPGEKMECRQAAGTDECRRFPRICRNHARRLARLF